MSNSNHPGSIRLPVLRSCHWSGGIRNSFIDEVDHHSSNSRSYSQRGHCDCSLLGQALEITSSARIAGAAAAGGLGLRLPLDLGAFPAAVEQLSLSQKRGVYTLPADVPIAQASVREYACPYL